MLRSITLAFWTLALLTGLKAQTSDIIVFSEAGEKFTLVIDGAVQNEEPATRVEARGIRNTTPMLVVNFADASMPALKQNGWMEHGQEYTMVITTNRKGAKVLRLRGQVAQGTSAAQPAVKAAPAEFRDDVSAPAATHDVVVTDVPATVKSTTTTTVTEDGADGGVSMSIDINGMGMNVAVKDGTGNTTTSTTTTTTTTTTTSSSDQSTMRSHHRSVPDRAVPTPETTETVVADGCGAPMTGSDFESAKSSIASKGFEDTKLTLAKQIIGGNCLSSEQVKTVMGLFGFEDTKLDFAKFAYDHVSDRKNYYKVNDAFGFSSSIDDLNEYIQSR